MMHIRKTLSRAGFAALLTLATAQLSAHDYTSLNEYQIDRANDATSENIMQIQLFLRDMVSQVHVSTRWPEQKLEMMGEALLHQKEETALGLEFFISTGIDVQSLQSQLKNPLVGRTVAGNQALDTVTTLIKYLGTLESQDAFIQEVYSGGKSSILYNLMAAQREKMDIYHTLFVVMPSPGQTTATPAVVTTPTVQTAAIPTVLYLLAGLGLCALAAMLFKPGRGETETRPHAET